MSTGLRCISYPNPRAALWLVAMTLLLFSLAWAATPVRVTLQIGDLQREGLRVKGIAVSLVDKGNSLDIQVHIDKLLIPGLDGSLSRLRLSCPHSRARWPGVQCRGAILEIGNSPWGHQRLSIDLDWRSAEDGKLAFSNLRYAGDRLKGRLTWSGNRWVLHVRARRIVLEKAGALAGWRRQWQLDSLTGRLSARIVVKGAGDRLLGASAKGRFKGVSYSDAKGEQAAEQVEGDFRISGEHRGATWSGTAGLSLGKGEIYSDPIFIELSKHPIHLSGQGDWKGKGLHLEKLVLDGGQMLHLEGQGTLNSDRFTIRSGEVRARSQNLGGLYADVLQPLLVGTFIDDLEVSGRAEVSLQWEEGRAKDAHAVVDRIDLNHRNGDFGINGLSAQLWWQQQGQGPDSQVGFDSGHLGSLRFGSGQLVFNASGRSAWLRRPLVLPFYQGQIKLDELSWVQTSNGPDVGFSLALSSVALEGLSKDLGWPPMQGTVSSEIPRARYREGRLAVDGDLRVNVFDGQISLRGLRLLELDSAAPVLETDVELRRLDLSQLTQTFSFGEIQGRLDGEVKGLQLVDWQPNRFDAHFYSSPRDELPHRISQRAVENLTELGNGVSGALSTSFLRFFERFSYDRIALRVRQEGANAWIDGIPASDGGYYLVKGSGIPRIDVIGRNRRVAWKDLLARLKSIRLDGVKMQ